MLARLQLREDAHWKEKLIPCAYRPFDTRWAYFSEVAMDYPRRELKENVAGKENFCLLSSRQQGTLGYRHNWVANSPANDCVVSTRSREANQVFPLYLYPAAKADLIDDGASGKRHPNLAPGFTADFSVRLKLDFVPDGCGDLTSTFGPEDVFHYAYAVFHSPAYRSRYAPFLKIDFPRLPLTGDMALFRSLCVWGTELVALHLMEQLPQLKTRYPVAGDNTVDNVRYTEPIDSVPGCVWVNKTQHFDNVSPGVWGYHIGGYQVCRKWLKDRQGRQLSYDDLTHYQGIVAALARTIELQTAIDDAIGEWPLR